VLCRVAGAASDVADAVMKQDGGQVARLLTSKADVNAAQPDGSTALHWSSYEADARTTALLLKARANPNVRTVTGVTPLELACESGNAEVVKLLLKGGADPNATLSHGETPLMMAARTGSVPILELLVGKGVNVDAREQLRGTTALMWAAANSNTDAVRFLISKGADVSARSNATRAGRAPYLAPSSRDRINEFVHGYGLAGLTVDAEAPDPNKGTDKERAAQAAKHQKFEEQKAAAARVLDQHPGDDENAHKLDKQWGGLTPLIFAARQGDLRTVQALLEAKADVNQKSEFGWTALLVATQNRYYKIGVYLLDHGADPNIQNEGGWSAIYLATDNRNIEGGDYPTRKPDIDHLDYIKRLLDAKADPNLRMRSSTETRTVFTHQWLFEDGATPFLRAAQSGDLMLMKLLLEHGADPKIPTIWNVTPLMVASGIGWVEGVTYEWSPQQTYDAVKLLLELGADVNAQDTLDERTALMGAAHKGRNDIVELLVQHGADLSIRDIGSRDTVHGLSGITWQAIDYADGLVRVGVQSAVPHPLTAALIRKLMIEHHLAVPPEGRTLASICVTDLCK
jgi:ankyrin repeat protein